MAVYVYARLAILSFPDGIVSGQCNLCHRSRGRAGSNAAALWFAYFSVASAGHSERLAQTAGCYGFASQASGNRDR